MSLDELEKFVSKLNPTEKVQLLRLIVQDMGDDIPGIEINPEICGGDACIVRTRIPVWVLIRSKQLGSSDVDLLKAYPNLRSDDLTNAWAYYRMHRDEIERQIQLNEED